MKKLARFDCIALCTRFPPSSFFLASFIKIHVCPLGWRQFLTISPHLWLKQGFLESFYILFAKSHFNDFCFNFGFDTILIAWFRAESHVWSNFLVNVNKHKVIFVQDKNMNSAKVSFSEREGVYFLDMHFFTFVI